MGDLSPHFYTGSSNGILSLSSRHAALQLLIEVIFEMKEMDLS
jgi:hypothetical protein